MPDLHISLSEDSQAFVRAQMAGGRFSTPDEYIAALIDSARKQATIDRVDALLIEGADSGPGVEVTPEYWRRKKEELSRKYDRADKP